MTMFDMDAVQLREALVRDIFCGNTPMVTASPGVGKSDIIRSIAKEYLMKVIDLRISQCEPVDMQGFPGVTEKNRMTFHVPEYFPLEGDPVPDGYKGWLLFLDEFNSGNKQTEVAAYKLILEKEVYLHKLHPNLRIITAGNLTTDRAIVNTQSTATTSRLTHYRMRVDDKIWIDWANENKIDHRIISFIKFKPTMLHKFDPATAELTFPCPRTWAFASKIVTNPQTGLPTETVDEIDKIRLAGTVGEGAAIEFYTYTQIYQNLPTLDQILANPATGWRVPTEPSEQFAITTMLSHAIDAQNIDSIITAISRLPMEMQVITFRDIYKRAPQLKGHDLIKEWIAKNAAVMF